MSVSQDYTFVVQPADTVPYGAIDKENMDVVQVFYDLSCYLESGGAIATVNFPSVTAIQPNGLNKNWKQDYPPDTTGTTVVPIPDTYPLTIVSLSITTNGTVVNMHLAAGTPGLSYIVSLVVVDTTPYRQKQIDLLVNIDQPLNPGLVGPADTTPAGSGGTLVVTTGSTALPAGFDGLVVLNNANNTSGIVITLPPAPTTGQTVEFIDAMGKDSAYPVTFYGANNAALDGDGSLTFVSSIAWDCLRWRWTGSPGWHLQALRYDFVA